VPFGPSDVELDELALQSFRFECHDCVVWILWFASERKKCLSFGTFSSEVTWYAAKNIASILYSVWLQAA